MKTSFNFSYKVCRTKTVTINIHTKRERIASKIKCIRVKYRKAFDIGRQSGGERVVATFYDLCSEIWYKVLKVASQER